MGQMQATWDVLGCGVVSVDDLVYLATYPPANTKARILGRDRQGGGLTGTALVAAARLGARAAFGGVLGYDELSLVAIAELEREGVDCSPMLRRPEARPCHSTVIVGRDTGSRNVFFSREGVMTPRPEEVTPELVRRCRVLFVDHLDLDVACHMAAAAAAVGVPVVADIEWKQYQRAEELFARIQHLIIPEHFALELTGAATTAEAVARLGTAERPCTAATAGERGCWFAVRGGPVQHQPAFPVAAVDTTGCGDVFHGAYAACLARGLGVAESIRFASATAAIKATRPGGGRPGIPRWDEVERFLGEAHRRPPQASDGR